MLFCFLLKLWQPSASKHFWSFLASATCGRDKVRQGIKSHHLGVTRGAAWRNFPGTGCAGLDCCTARAATEEDRSLCLPFIATASSGAAELAQGFCRCYSLGWCGKGKGELGGGNRNQMVLQISSVSVPILAARASAVPGSCEVLYGLTNLCLPIMKPCH